MRRILLSLLLATLAGTAAAEMKPFELNMDRVKMVDVKKPLAFGSTYFIPTVNLRVSASGDVWAQQKNTVFKTNNSKAHGRFYVKGLDKAFVQGLARQVQDDLVAKLRAAGYTVMTYDDLKGETDIAGHDRDKADPQWGLPIEGKENLDFALISPSDEQTFDVPLTGPLFWMRGVAKDKQVIIIVPEITFEVPVMVGETESTYSTFKAGISVNPAMRLNGAMVWVMDGKQRSGTIQIQQHGKRLASEKAGTPKLVDEDTTSFSSSWKSNKSNWVMDLDPTAFSDGLLRVSYAVNDLIVKEAKDAH